MKGHFESGPAPTCDSPFGICTRGTLTGAIRADYGFVMQQLLEHGDPSIPSVAFFTGKSTMTAKSGVITGTDAGALDLNPFGTGAFTTLITITGGSAEYAGASGYLQIRGRLDFATGGASGDYSGQLCSP